MLPLLSLVRKTIAETNPTMNLLKYKAPFDNFLLPLQIATCNFWWDGSCRWDLNHDLVFRSEHLAGTKINVNVDNGIQGVLSKEN